MPAPPAPSGTDSAGLRLHTRRCLRHPVREAVAQCPACGGAFCRECVVEHDGRVLCADCLARAAAAAASARPPRFTALGRAVAAAAGGLVLWLCFYELGALLLKIPPGFHDGTVWQSAIP